MKIIVNFFAGLIGIVFIMGLAINLAWPKNLSTRPSSLVGSVFGY